MVEQVVKSHSLKQQAETSANRDVRGEVSSRTTFQRSAKGHISIAECDPTGKFIVLENTQSKKMSSILYDSTTETESTELESEPSPSTEQGEENIGEWKIKRKVDGQKELVYTFPVNISIKAGKSLKVWARDQGGKNNPPAELVFDGEDSWHTGSNVQTSLINKDGEVYSLYQENLRLFP